MVGILGLVSINNDCEIMWSAQNTHHEEESWQFPRTVVFVLEDILGVVFGLSRGVWVVEVGLVTADDLSFRRHFEYRDEAVSGVLIVVVRRLE